MNTAKHTKLKWIKGLILTSQVLLLLFTAQWLVNQYEDQQARLKKDLTHLFTDVQKGIHDSLVLSNLVDTSAVNMAIAVYGEETRDDEPRKIKIPGDALHRLLAAISPVSGSEEKKLFRLDTIAFNEIFGSEMKKSGWNFSSQWISSSDSNKKGSNALFIQSSFFTHANGIVIRNYGGYLLRKMLPQILFVIILLSLCAAASWLAYNSLKSQIKLSSLKDDFISNMSHELKTPIATVKVALEALGNYNIIDDPKVNREYLGMATSEMDRLELLATRVLNTSLLESGRMQLQREHYDLRQLVQEVIQAMYLRVQNQEAHISFEVEGSSFLVNMDKLHMQGVLVNLIDNSLKYGDKPVNICVKLIEKNGRVQLSLTDNGPGIPEEYREKVFEKFFRIPTGNRHKTKGYGLGLSYAAQVMRQHNGSINVNNVAEGGCMFTLMF